jgi:hypothetical protein
MIGQLLAELANVQSAKFASFTYKAKGTGEVAKHTVLLNFSVEEAYKKDIELVNSIFDNATDPLEKTAAGEILASLAVSLQEGAGNNPAYTHGEAARGKNCETYIHVKDIAGLMIHAETGSLHVKGMAITKEVIEQGTYKKVNSAPLTIAKNKIRSQLRSGKIRQFVLDGLQSVRINGETLELVSP